MNQNQGVGHVASKVAMAPDDSERLLDDYAAKVNDHGWTSDEAVGFLREHADDSRFLSMVLYCQRRLIGS